MSIVQLIRGTATLKPPAVDLCFKRVRDECDTTITKLIADILRDHPTLPDMLESIETMATDAELDMSITIENECGDCQDKRDFDGYIGSGEIADAAEVLRDLFKA